MNPDKDKEPKLSAGYRRYFPIVFAIISGANLVMAWSEYMSGRGTYGISQLVQAFGSGVIAVLWQRKL